VRRGKGARWAGCVMKVEKFDDLGFVPKIVDVLRKPPNAPNEWNRVSFSLHGIQCVASARMIAMASSSVSLVCSN